MIKLIDLSRKEYLLFLFGFLITLFNTVNLQQNTVLILSIPQYLLVFYYILNKQYHVSFLLHALFISACVSGGIVIEDGVSPFLYTKMRVYGPLTFNIIVLVLLWLLVKNRGIRVNMESLLLRVRKIIIYLLISGSLIGFIGCVFIEYNDWHYWLTRFLFISESFLFVDIFIHLYNESFSKVFATVVVCMMAAAPVASVVSFTVFGAQTYYGYESIPLYTPLLSLTPCLIIALFQVNNFKIKVISLIGLVFYGIHLTILSRGNQFLDIFVALLLLGYLVYFKKSKQFEIKALRLLLPAVIVIIPFAINGIISSSDVSLNKFEQFASLFRLFNLSNGGVTLQFDEVGSSPYIRIGELANIINEGIHNFFSFILGQGFGGYYTDSLHFFDGLDLSRGAFSDESAASGRFYTAHSAIPSVLFYNGLIGLFFMLKLAFLYLKKVDRTFLVFAAFVLFVQSFYFDMYGCFAFTMALFGAEHLLNSSSNKITEIPNNSHEDPLL